MIPQDQKSADWLAYRRSRIGSSDAPIIMQISPYNTPFGLYCEKIGYKEPKKMTSAMQRGHDLEDQARKQFIEKTGIFMTPRVMEHPEFPWLIASLDGISENLEILEIKCNNSTYHKIAMENDIIDHHFCQLQHQLLVTGANKVYYYSFDGENGVMVEVYRDPDYIDKLFLKEHEFYQCMVTMVPPLLTEKDYFERKDALWTDLANEYNSVDSQLTLLQERKDVLRSMLIIAANKQSCRGAGIKVQHQYRRGNIDYNELVKKHNIDPEPFRKESTECWRIINE